MDVPSLLNAMTHKLIIEILTIRKSLESKVFAADLGLRKCTLGQPLLACMAGLYYYKTVIR
jgi:hypothetical protein